MKLFKINFDFYKPNINPSKCQSSTPTVSLAGRGRACAPKRGTQRPPHRLTRFLSFSPDKKTSKNPRRPFEKEKLINE